MAEIIHMDPKRLLSEKKSAATRQKRKVFAARKVLHSTRGRMKCEKCGLSVDVEARGFGSGHTLRVPYRFCDGCREEYIDYIERLKGGGDTECYWRNAEWLESWRRWIDYQGALDRFARSKEFAKLLQELQDTTP